MSKSTQTERVLAYMRERGSVTQLEAQTELGVSRLAARISDLAKQGHVITRRTETVKNRFQEPCRVTRYGLGDAE